MKTLILFRHAKSDWSAGETNDHARPLASRGEKAAQAMGRFLQKIGEIPDSVVTSSAVRAVTTVELAAKTGEWNCNKRVTDRLYNCSPADMLKAIKAEPDTSETLLIAGHEPTCSETIALLTGKARIRFSTGAMARLDLAIDKWRQADFGGAELIWLVPPKLVKKLL